MTYDMSWLARAGQANNTETMHLLLDAAFVKKLAGSPCTIGAQHRTTANIDSAAPSSTRLCSDIVPWSTSSHRLHHCQHNSVAPSSVWLGIYITPWPCCLDSVIMNIDSGGLVRTSLTRVHFYLYRRPRLEASASSPPSYGTLRQIS
jgi:hypothetical protein